MVIYDKDLSLVHTLTALAAADLLTTVREPEDVHVTWTLGVDVAERREIAHQPREHAVMCAGCRMPTTRVHGVCGTCLRGGRDPRTLACDRCGGRE